MYLVFKYISTMYLILNTFHLVYKYIDVFSVHHWIGIN